MTAQKQAVAGLRADLGLKLIDSVPRAMVAVIVLCFVCRGHTRQGPNTVQWGGSGAPTPANPGARSIRPLTRSGKRTFRTSFSRGAGGQSTTT